MPRRPLLSRSLVVALALLPGSVACGKKGPPLAPTIQVPAAVGKIDARRVGSDVLVTLQVPSENIDASLPPSIARIDVYGYTGRAAPPRTRWPELGMLVASVPVVPAPIGQPTAPPLTASAEGAIPGVTVTVRDALTAEDLVQGPVAPVVSARPTPPVVAAADARELPLRRFYTALPFSSRGRPGPPGLVTELPLDPLPDPPADVQPTILETSLVLMWQPSGGLVGYLLERGLAPENLPDEDLDSAALAATPLNAAVAGPTRYNVYRDPPLLAAVVQPAHQPWAVAPEAPLNPQPLIEPQFSDAVAFGRPRCYTIRAIRGTPPQTIESEPSPRACLTPADVFPPAPPNALAAVAAEGAISLIWEPNNEPDLGGYLILRGKPGDATLQPLTETPLTEARYRDMAVMPGVRYVYAVVAVDTAVPKANVSLESVRVEETAR